MRHKRFSPYSLDIFIPDLKVNIGGQSGVGTKVGLFLSFTFLATFLTMSIFTISEYLDTRSPKVSQSVLPTARPPVMSFTEDKLFPIMSFRYQLLAPLTKAELDRFVTIDFSIYEMMQDETGAIVSSIKSMKTAPCAEVVAQGRLRTFEASSREVREDVLSHGICIDSDDQDVTLGRGTDREPYFKQVMLRVLPCSLQAGCASEEELSQIVFATNIPKAIPDYSNKRNPIHYVTLPEEATYLSSGLSAQQTLNLIKTEIVDEAGFMLGTRLSKAFTSVENTRYNVAIRNSSIIRCTKEQIAQLSCPHYWQQTMLTSSKKIVIKRQYKGMVETFSELGGIIEMLFMLFYFPYTMYNNRVLKEKLIEIIHGIKRPIKPKIATAAIGGVSEYPMQTNEEYQALKKQYKQLFGSIESCLDLVSLSKEVRSIMKCLRASGLELPIPTSEQPGHYKKQRLWYFDPPSRGLQEMTQYPPQLDVLFDSPAHNTSRRLIDTNSNKSIQENLNPRSRMKQKSSLLFSKVSPRRLHPKSSLADPKGAVDKVCFPVNLLDARTHFKAEKDEGLQISSKTLPDPNRKH